MSLLSSANLVKAKMVQIIPEHADFKGLVLSITTYDQTTAPYRQIVR